jgi:hypothetical protein
MPGPLPKDPAIRQRRNKPRASASQLPPETSPIKRAPSLPDNPLGEWNKLTETWWRDIWSSPQSTEFLRADLGALFRLAILVDMFWKKGNLSVAKEIRVLEREFGLTPLARRRLEWQVVSTEDAKDKHHSRRSQQAITVTGDGDPRDILNQ